MNPVPGSLSHQRRLSRSNSTSSSVVTVKKAASLSPSASQTPRLRARPVSPEQAAVAILSLPTSSSNRPSGSRSRRSSVTENKLAPYNLNINRWSQSTASSSGAVENEQLRKRRSSSARRMSFGATPVLSLSTGSGSMSTSERRSNSRRSRSPRKKAPPNLKLQPDPLAASSIKPTFQGLNSTTSSTEMATPLTSELLSTVNSATDSQDYFGQMWTNAQTKNMGLDASQSMSIHYAITGAPRNGESRHRRGPGNTTGSAAAPTSPDATRRAGHSRNRERSTRGSTDPAPGSSMSSIRSDQSRGRGHRSPTQKSMLSKALTKANTAVLLDKALNFDGAVNAYAEACELLKEVMIRSADEEDYKKLSSIWSTYSNRIAEIRAELREMNGSSSTQYDKELPEMPPPDEPVEDFYEDDLPIMTSDHSRIVNVVSIPPRLESMLPSTIGDGRQPGPARGEMAGPPPVNVLVAKPLPGANTGLVLPMQSKYMPPPLSPRRFHSPQFTPVELPAGLPEGLPAELPAELPAGVPAELPASQDHAVNSPRKGQHTRDDSTESTSWLDTIDESASSASSSHLSSLDLNPDRGADLAAEIEAGIDAALNAAINTAYPDERSPETTRPPDSPESDPPRHEMIERGNLRLPSPRHESSERAAIDLKSHGISIMDYDDDEAEEEERLLEEMTRGFVLDDFNFDKRSKSALPRQSDSSGMSGRTWGSSVASTTITSGTTLSTLAESVENPAKQRIPPPPLGTALPAPPATVLPPPTVPPRPTVPPPPAPHSRQASIERGALPGVRDRRLSGQNAKQLKIETHVRRSSISPPAASNPLSAIPLPKIQVPSLAVQLTLPPPKTLSGPPSTSTLVTAPLTPMTSVHSGDSIASESPATSALHGGSQGTVDETNKTPVSPSRMMLPPPTAIRKNLSSSSLKLRNLSVQTPDPTESPGTPGSAVFPPDSRRGFPGNAPAIPTPTGVNFNITGQSVGGMYLFDEYIGSPNTPRTPRTPNNMSSNAPSPLEHCPESFLLRPFWLMRCLYQTIAHPKGGYLTTKLFLPRDIWRVKNVKLKAVEEKVSQCDLLTAALLKLANVDNLDADAVLEELQSFEVVMEQVRSFLHKKLGGDVGLSASASLFKGSPSTEAPPETMDSKAGPPSAGASAAKSFASGWRKLRSKSSGPTIHTTYSVPSAKDFSAHLGHTSTSAHSMSTVPMKSSFNPTSSRGMARRVPPSSINLTHMGANAQYMSSLAHLFDAAQVLDAVARQVEDPGLKNISKTHVGLELSVRCAAEFFAFYILRFVIGDVQILVDKFIKRGTEWVLT